MFASSNVSKISAVQKSQLACLNPLLGRYGLLNLSNSIYHLSNLLSLRTSFQNLLGRYARVVKRTRENRRRRCQILAADVQIYRSERICGGHSPKFFFSDELVVVSPLTPSRNFKRLQMKDVPRRNRSFWIRLGDGIAGNETAFE